MSKLNQNQAAASANVDSEFYHGTYMSQMNRIGKITGYGGAALSFMPLMYLWISPGLSPDWPAFATAMLTCISTFLVVQIVEPISYFPVLGPVGTYIAFLSGNISNMRVPCATVAQKAAGVEPGTPQGSLIATLGMAVSVIFNVTVLTIGAILGVGILSALPPEVKVSLNYLLPALFGALLVQSSMKDPKQGLVMTGFALAFYSILKLGWLDFIPGARNWMGILLTVFISILLGIKRHKQTA